MTETYNVSSGTGLRPNLKAALLSGLAAVALSGCSTWSSVLETVFGGPEETGPAVVQTAGVTSVDEFPMTWEPAAQKPGTWVASQPGDASADVTVIAVGDTQDLYAAEDDDDVMAQIAEAAILEGEAEDGVVQMADAGELSELRGGFVTRFGILSIGFDIKTFINGVLQVQNIFNLVGNIKDINGIDGTVAGEGNPPVTPVQLVTITSPPPGSSGPPTVTQSTPTPPPAPLQQTAPPPAPPPPPPAPQQLTAPPPAPTPPPAPVTQSTPPPAPVTQSTPPPAPVTPAPAPPAPPPVTAEQVTGIAPKVTVTNVAGGVTKIENEINDGQTTITNQVSGGGVQSIVVNNAGQIDINHVTSLVIGLSDPSGFIGSVTSGVKTGNKPNGMVSGFRASLFGAISR